MPSTSEASTKVSDRVVRATLRTTRTMRGTSGMAIAVITVATPPRNSATRTMASRIGGMAMAASMTRITR